jgi:hypothetical protein
MYVRLVPSPATYPIALNNINFFMVFLHPDRRDVLDSQNHAQKSYIHPPSGHHEETRTCVGDTILHVVAVGGLPVGHGHTAETPLH